MTQTIPDAPWIRDVERFGMDTEPPVYCPICGEETEYFYLDQSGDVIGCDNCIRHIDTDSYRINH